MKNTPWFNERGELLRDIPEEMLTQCSHPGPCDLDVRDVRNELEFEVPRHLAIPYLRQYGAWNDNELNTLSDDELADKILWLFAGDLQDGKVSSVDELSLEC